MPLRKPAALPEGAPPAPPAAWQSALRAAARAALRSPWAKPVLFVICLGPMAWLLRGIWLDDLGANPAEFLIRATGDWTLRALCLVLAVTPLRVTLGLPELARLRRMLGLFTGFYACLHLIGYAWFDMGWDLPDIAVDIAKHIQYENLTWRITANYLRQLLAIEPKLNTLHIAVLIAIPTMVTIHV